MSLPYFFNELRVKMVKVYTEEFSEPEKRAQKREKLIAAALDTPEGKGLVENALNGPRYMKNQFIGELRAVEGFLKDLEGEDVPHKLRIKYRARKSALKLLLKNRYSDY